jgi:hypothetical protein
MFLGHYAAAFAAKKFAPKASLGTLILAGQLLDLVWPIFLLLGFEHVRINPGSTKVTPLDFYHYPFTHSLLAAVVWGLAFALIYFYFTRQKTSAWVFGVLVLSHWFLDLIVHKPDLPLSFNGKILFGLGIWNYLSFTLLLEFSLFISGVIVYLKTTQRINPQSLYSFWLLVLFLVAIYIVNIITPPPPSEMAIAIAGLATWLFVPWGYYIDRHRKII